MQKNISLDKFKILSGSMLKLIAVISMLIDHIAYILEDDLTFMGNVLFTVGDTEYTVYYIMRLIGRLAFPLFCFLITEGYVHTKNVKKYCLRLLIFAAISEIPFNLLETSHLSHYQFTYPLKQNVFFTLLLGVLAIYVFEKASNHLYKFCLVGSILALSLVLKADYGMTGVILILVIYVLRQSPSIQAVISYFILPSAGKLFAFAAFVPINMYNGERGFIKSKALKLGFYIFYPLHILVLVIIKYIISGV